MNARKNSLILIIEPKTFRMQGKRRSNQQGALTCSRPSRKTTSMKEPSRRFDFHIPESRNKFSPQEDQLIRSYVKQNGTGKWKVLASLLPGRSQRTVRQRWFEHLSEDIKNDQFTTKENFMLWILVGELGGKWGSISKHIKGRGPRTLRNKWAYFKQELKLRFEKIWSFCQERRYFRNKKELLIEISKKEDLFASLQKESFNEDSELLEEFDRMKIEDPINFLDHIQEESNTGSLTERDIFYNNEDSFRESITENSELLEEFDNMNLEDPIGPLEKIEENTNTGSLTDKNVGQDEEQRVQEQEKGEEKIKLEKSPYGLSFNTKSQEHLKMVTSFGGEKPHSFRQDCIQKIKLSLKTAESQELYRSDE